MDRALDAARWDRLLADVSEVVELFSPELRALYVSPAMQPLLGHRRADVIGRSALDFLHVDDRAVVAEAFGRLLEAPGATSVGAFRVLAHDGTWRWVEARTTNRLHEPSIGAIVSTWRVVEARARAEATEPTPARPAGDGDDAGYALRLLRDHRDLAAAVGRASTARQIASLTVAAMRRTPGVDVAAFYLFERSTGDLVLADSDGASAAFLAENSRYAADTPRARWLAEIAAVQARPQELPIEGRHSPTLAAEGLRTLSVVTLRKRDRVLGCVNLASRTLEAFPAAVGAAAEAIAAIASEALAGLEADRRERESADLHRALFETMAQGVVYHDRSGVITGANPAACEILGLALDELIGRTSIDPRWRLLRADGSPFPGEEHPAMVALRTGRPQRGVRMGVTQPRTETTRWLVVDAFAHFEEGDPTPARVHAVLTDVTEARATELALRAKVEEYDALVSASLDGYNVVDPSGRFVDANPRFCKLLGLSLAELRTKSPRDVDAGRSEADVRGVMEQVASRGWARFEVRHRRADGSTFDSEVSCWLVPSSGKMVSFVRDLSERNATTEALRKSDEQLRQSQKMEAIGRLAGGVAHDFNNLLTVINGGVELAMESLHERDPLRADLAEIETAGKRAAALTRQLLTFSRRQIVQARVVDVNAIVRDLERMLRRLIGEDVTLHVRVAAGEAPVFADPGQLEQVVVNLAVNARDAMPSGGTLGIGTAPRDSDALDAERPVELGPGRYLLLTVEDTGCGMDAATLERIFEPFFTTKGHAGTGLGLSTVYGIVEQGRGHVRARSVVGEGTCFEVWLPLSDQPLEGALRPSRADARAKGRETILVVEDDHAVRQLVRAVLKASGYQVLVAANGEEALAQYGEGGQGIDLVLTDLVMPGIGGRELARRLRERAPAMKIIFTSGYPDDAQPGPAGSLERVHYLPKPVDVATLRATVRRLLDEPG